jgi:GMP synthase-like glutamine amidotransferase
VGKWLREQGVECNAVLVPEASRLPGPHGYDLVVALGSEHSAADEHAWIHAEAGLLRDCHRSGVPVLGICFGGQLLARALGGTVHRGAVCEVGWQTVRTRRDAVVETGPWFQWHFDTLVPPVGAEVIADSPAGVEAFSLGASMGLQFHPEVTVEIVAAWVRVYGHELAAHGVDGARLVAAAERPAVAAGRVARLMDSFAVRVGLALDRACERGLELAD